jgi:hypothetical protein
MTRSLREVSEMAIVPLRERNTPTLKAPKPLVEKRARESIPIIFLSLVNFI